MEKRQKQKNKKNNDKAKGAVAMPAKNKNVKRPTITFQKRNKLNSLVVELLELTTVATPTAPDAEWEQYLKIQNVLTEIMALEAPLRRQTENSSPEARLAKIDAFFQWATENGIKTDCVKIAQFAGYDLGLMATRDIAKGEGFCSVPRKLMLSEENLDKHASQQPHLGTMTNLKLAYVLMVEAMQEESFWKPYIDVLPETYTSVLYFTKDDMELLRSSSAFSSAIRQCKAIARQYAVIYNCTHQTKRSDNMLFRAFVEQLNYDLYRWAVSTAMTRENLIPCQRANDTADGAPIMIAALIPFWDMANHRHGKITSFYNMENNLMESAAQDDFKAGEQVFIHYGDRFNFELMIHNGFINPAHPDDGINIKLGLGTSDTLKTLRWELLTKINLARKNSLAVLKEPKYISPELLAFVRIFNMNNEQLKHWASCGREMDLLHNDCALETDLEVKTWKYLEIRLMLLARTYRTKLEEDEAQLAMHKSGKIQLNYIGAMILEYLTLEKRILFDALEYAKQRAKS